MCEIEIDYQRPSGSTELSKAQPMPLPEQRFEAVRHNLFSTLTAVCNTIALLQKLNYAEPNDWSKLLPNGHPNEVMEILTKRIRVG